MTAGERVQTLDVFGERSAASRAADSQPVAGRMLSGRAVGYPREAAFPSRIRRIELQRPRKAGALGGVLTVMAAIVLLLWVMGFGLSLVASLIMRGS